MKEQNIKKGKKYLVIGVLILFLAILGSSVAYYLARVQGSLSGNAAGTELAINVEKLSSKATGDLIPLDNDLETLNLAAAGYDDNGACVDINGYSVCQIYHITLTNKGNVPLTVNGTVTLSGQNVPNIDCARMSDATTVANNNSCMGGNIFVSGDTLAANDHNDYYVMVYINNLDEPQTDSGAFNGTVTFTTEDGKKVKGRFTKPFNLVKHIEELYDLNGGTTDNKTAKTEVTNNEIKYNYATNVGLMNDRLGGTTTSLDDGNIRYYGASPSNYIDIGDKYEYSATGNGNWEIVAPGAFESAEQCLSSLSNFTDEMVEQYYGSFGFTTKAQFCDVKEIPAGTPILWRIIGVFDGKLRIVRDESIGNYSYDTSASNVNGGEGINEWSQADLMKLLNPGYNNNQDLDNNGNTVTVNNSLWYNSEGGTCYNGQSNATTECDFTTSGLSDEAKEYVVDQTLYLGGFDSRNVFANQAWEAERGSNVIQNPKDGIARTTKWTGKVALIYPSDYGYAADLNENNCKGYLNTFNSCSSNWMAQNLWLISPSTDITVNSLNVFNGSLDTSSLLNKIPILPTLLLDSSALAESGNGSKETPYVLTS